MKKLLVVVLCLAGLVCAGCGGDSGSDNPAAATTVTSTNVTLSQSFVIPSAAISVASIRAATYWKEFYLKINGVEYAPSTYTANTTASTITLTWTRTFTKTELGTAWDSTNKYITNVQLIEGGQPILTLNYVYANDQATTESGTPTEVPAVITLTPDTTTGGLVVSVTSGTASATTLITSGSDTLYLEAIYYTKSTGTLATLTSDVTDVPAPNATFTLYFNTVVASATDNWSISVTNTTTNVTFTLTSTSDSGLFSVTPTTSGSRTILTIGVVGNSSKKLDFSTNYKVTLNSTSLVRADKTSIKFGSVTRTFKTAAQ